MSPQEEVTVARMSRHRSLMTIVRLIVAQVVQLSFVVGTALYAAVLLAVA